jgi:hypothetical protein
VNDGATRVRWRRVAPAHLSVAVAGLYALVMLGFVVVLTGILLFAGDTVDSVPWVMFSIVFAAVTGSVAFRMSRMGLFVNDVGVRNQKLLTTRTFAWEDIRTFKIDPLRGLGFLATGSKAIWIVPMSGSAIQTYVTCGMVPLPGVVHSEERVRAVLAELTRSLVRGRDVS